MLVVRLILVSFICFALVACGDDAPEQSSSTSAARSQAESQTPATPQVKAVSQSAGGITVDILPENPTVSDCLRAVIHGDPGRSAVIWKVNNEVASSGTDTQFCGDNYKRGDSVTVEVGTSDKGAKTSISIGNSLPRVVDISSTPDEIFAGTDVSVTPVAEDVDGDDVDFTYQWVINGDADPELTDSTLPGNRISKGDSIQVLIVPNDFFEDGPTYESYATDVPNAAPVITSQPPQGISSLDYRYQVDVSDPDDSQFTYRLDEAPDGMTIDSASGLIRWSLADVTPGDYTIAIIVTDPEGAEGAQEYSLSLGAAE